MLRKLNGVARGTLNSEEAGSIPARGAKYRKTMGAQAYDLIDDFDLKGSVVEIGTERGEGSTKYLAAACKEAGNKFYTVDFDLNAPSFPSLNQYRMRGEMFFEDHFPDDEKICFAYLDGFDWVWPTLEGILDWQLDQIEHYATYGITMNNENSQLSHLSLTQSVVESAADKCVILFDDTYLKAPDYENLSFDGKGGMACDWLIEQGWEQIHLSQPVAKAFCNWDREVV